MPPPGARACSCATVILVCALAGCPGAPPADLADGSAAPGPADLAPPGDLAGAPDLAAPACPRNVDVVIYTESGWNELADALGADASPCAQHYISLPAPAGDKTYPRGPLEPMKMRGRGPAFHAMAEFHWATWSQVSGMSYYDKGVEFRRRMVDGGYDVDAGDLWAINELPSSVRYDPATRSNALDVIRGLHDGPPGATPVRGAVFIVGLGQQTVNFAVYKPNLEGLLADGDFFTGVAPNARFWSQETYANPGNTCVDGAAPDAWSARLDAYTQHVGRLAAAGPASADAARAYLAAAYAPLGNAAYQSAAYQTAGLPLDQMERFVLSQVYAARALQEQAMRAQIGFGWTWQATVSADDIKALAAQLAGALHRAYALDGGSAQAACGPPGMDLCGCSVAGARFNDGWNTFGTW